MSMKMTRCLAISAIFALLILMTSCSDLGNKEAEAEAEREKALPAQEVRVEKVRRGSITENIAVTGTVKPYRESKLGPKLAGRIGKVHVEEGDLVKEGQPLVSLDTSELLIARDRAVAMLETVKAQVNQAEVQLRNTRREWERLKALYEKKIISEQKFEKMDAAKEMAESQLALARARLNEALKGLEHCEDQLSDAVTRAPFDGVVVGKYVNEGEIVSPMAPRPMIWLMDISRVYVEAEVPEKRFAQIKPGQSAVIAVDGLPGRVFSGRVVLVKPFVNPVSRTFLVKIEIPNPEMLLKSGMFARVKIEVKSIKNALLVPMKAVLQRGGRNIAFVVENGVAKKRELKTGISDEKMIQVLAGLREGELVIVEGNYGMIDGTRVKPVM